MRGMVWVRLSPKRVGDEITLDEYNAYQYLLYHMDCWGETVTLSTLETSGEYATYTLRDPQEVLEWHGMLSYRVLRDVTLKNYFEIKVSDSSLIPKIKRVQFYYKNPKTYEIDTEENPIHSDPYDDSSSLVTEETVSASDSEEIGQWSVSEAKPSESLEDDFELITVDVTAGSDCVQVPFCVADDEGVITGITEAESLLGNRFRLYFDYTDPQIDAANGRANTSDEILLDTVYEINRLLEFAPTDGTKIIYRLDSNMTYKLTKTNTIWDGMNVEFRGGTNVNAVLDCSTCGRAFIVQDEAELTLVNITIKNGNVTNANGNSSFYRGYGGGVLVIYDQNKNSEYFGILTMDNCEISNCKADYGGAIYSFHCGLNLTNTVFKSNTATVTGGAIYYAAQNVIITMESVTGKKGEKVVMTCHVETVDGEPVTTGLVRFYVGDDLETVVDTYTMSKSTQAGNTPGDGLFYYVIPDNSGSSIPVTAYYIGTRDLEVAATQAYIYVVIPYTVTASIDDVYNVFPGDTITLTSDVLSSDKLPFSEYDGCFIVDGERQEYVSSTTGTYTMDYTVSSSAKNDLSVTFDIPDATCTSNTATVHLIYGITGYFVNTGNLKADGTSDSISDEMAANWKSVGVTDLYVRSVSGLDDIKGTVLYETIGKADSSIRIHATLNVFYNISGTTTDERWPSDLDARCTKIKNDIKKIHEGVGDSITGFCLDYIRLRGVDPVTDQSHVTTIQGYLKDITDYIRALNPNYTISACVMPETDSAQYTYGQKPTAMLEYVHYLIPMVYKGNYGGDLDWVKETMGWYLCHVSQVRCIGDLQTYSDDNNVYKTRLDKEALEQDLKALMDAVYYTDSTCEHDHKHRDNGYILFRDGCIISYPISYKKWRGVE